MSQFLYNLGFVACCLVAVSYIGLNSLTGIKVVISDELPISIGWLFVLAICFFGYKINWGGPPPQKK